MKQINFESGRSMVEMIGTLAIIGVLSVGAIAGYSYGMNKYRANQTMHDISLRTVDLLTQASQGRATLSLAEWDKETTIYDFANPAYVEGENLISFDVGTTKKIPQSVCQMVFDGLANTAVQIDINAERADSNETCGTDNTMTFYFEGGGNGTGGETGEQCGDTVCGTCQKCENESCVTVANYETKCKVNGQSGWCISGVCEADSCNCGTGQYCEDTNESPEHPTSSTTCTNLDFQTVDIDGTTYYVSNNKMSWWDAVSACNAMNTNGMVEISDLVNGWIENEVAYELTKLGQTLDSDFFGGMPTCIWTNLSDNQHSSYFISLFHGTGASSSYHRNYDNNGCYIHAVCK